MSTILITGASSGLGLAFLSHYITAPSVSRIIALDVVPLPQLSLPSSQISRIQSYKSDISDPDSLSRIAKELEGTPIDVVIHSAGIRGLVPEVLEKTRDVAAAETAEVMDKQTMMKTFEINAYGTFVLIQTLLPNLRAAKDPKVIVMSSRMGSISANVGGGGYAYRASKAALNSVVRSFSIDVPEVVFLLVHPGRVETGLVAWKEEGAFAVDEVLDDLVKLMSGVKKEDSGSFVDRWGKTIAW